jgi:mRNA-degrading endonuclease RelE of RelBE toxin-antitoxin system
VGDVIWESGAIEALIELSHRDQRQSRRLARALFAFADTGVGDALKLQASGDRWRLRVGDWRVIFIREGATIRVTEVVNRRDAYR